MFKITLKTLCNVLAKPSILNQKGHTLNLNWITGNNSNKAKRLTTGDLGIFVKQFLLYIRHQAKYVDSEIAPVLYTIKPLFVNSVVEQLLSSVHATRKKLGDLFTGQGVQHNA